MEYTNKKCWRDLIKKKNACPCTSCRFQPYLSWILRCTVPFLPSLPWDCANSHLSLAYFCLLRVPLCIPCFPAHNVAMPALLWMCLVHVQTDVHPYKPEQKKIESIRQTDAMVNEAMHGWEGCQGVQMDFDVERFMMISVQQRKPKSPHTITCILTYSTFRTCKQLCVLVSKSYLKKIPFCYEALWL